MQMKHWDRSFEKGLLHLVKVILCECAIEKSKHDGLKEKDITRKATM